ncbi:hypothetical protein PVAP13_5NG265800 [Panicum virgatum]|uniref:Uncharacterized protein n=1 Tax=Panicum virgatum TaxID=38727 RepID=A0A8T0RL79_PANVG|nr:hypothetical protein PVAP13_5NG265800 [Panicum virgatum]
MWGFAGRSSEPFLKQASFNSSCRQVQEMSGGQVQEEEEHKGAGGYGTFQGPPSYPPPRPPPLGYPQPVRAAAPPAPGRVRGHDRLPCCGIGFGWFLGVINIILLLLFLLLFFNNHS